MHPQANQAVYRMVRAAQQAGWKPTFNDDALDVGGEDRNGNAREHIPGVAQWDVIDAEHGDDARTWCCILEHYEVTYGVVLCTEVLEHVRFWPLVVRTCFEACDSGGLIIITCAAPGRPEHSATGAARLEPGEWYENVDSGEFYDLIMEVFKPSRWEMTVRTAPDDIYFWGIK